MNCIDLIDILDKGEDSYHQFKENFNSIDNLAVEICAFANSDGGTIIVGASNKGEIIGISRENLDKLNQWISNTTSSKIDPPIFVNTEILMCDKKRILIIHVSRGTNKPYAVNKTEFWVKTGADKRRATREELFRLMQASNLLYADEIETDSNFDNFDIEYFKTFYKKYYKEDIKKIEIPTAKLLTNLKLMNNNKLTLAGLLLFGKNPEYKKPQFVIKATYFDGQDISVNNYIDSENITRKLINHFQGGISFIKRNLRRIQKNNDFNAPGTLEIPENAFKEAIANAIIHRDYFINSQIFIFMFNNRVEIISPGLLPNTINEENIKVGVHVERNPTILSFLEKDKEFSYSGRGSGIPRIIKKCKTENVKVEFINDKSKQQFIVRFYRP